VLLVWCSQYHDVEAIKVEIMTEESVTIENSSEEPIVVIEGHETFRVMNVVSVTYVLPYPHPVINLQEAEGPFRCFEVTVALADAQAIAMALEEWTNPRPSTHELFVSTLQSLHVDVIAVRIIKQELGVYYAELDLMSARGQVVIPCRLTDGLAIALRQIVPAPVLCAESVLQGHY
jgi:bifunctional DNase/RNase